MNPHWAQVRFRNFNIFEHVWIFYMSPKRVQMHQTELTEAE